MIAAKEHKDNKVFFCRKIRLVIARERSERSNPDKIAAKERRDNKVFLPVKQYSVIARERSDRSNPVKIKLLRNNGNLLHYLSFFFARSVSRPHLSAKFFVSFVFSRGNFFSLFRAVDTTTASFGNKLCTLLRLTLPLLPFRHLPVCNR